MKPTKYSVLSVVLVLLSAHAFAQPRPEVAVVPAESGRVHRIVPLAPLTRDFEVLYGDPEKAGEPFVMRVRELAGGIIPPHRHPVDEHITVVQGTLYFGVGDSFERASLKEVKTGGYIFIPKGSVMFGLTLEAAIVQVHGMGPFHIQWRAGSSWQQGNKTLDSPDAGSYFKFKRGDRVVTPRGIGRIKQGYDTGEYVGYDIEREDGSLFMAEECEIEGVAQSTSVVRRCFANLVSTPEKTHRAH